MFTSRCLPALFLTPIVSFIVPVANNYFSVVEAPGTREGADLRSESSRGRPGDMSSRCRPVVAATSFRWLTTRAIRLRNYFSVVEAPGIREGADLRSESSRGRPDNKSSRCRPVVAARPSKLTKRCAYNQGK